MKEEWKKRKMREGKNKCIKEKEMKKITKGKK